MAIVASVVLFALLSGIVVSVGAALLAKLWFPNWGFLKTLRGGQGSGHFLRWCEKTKSYRSGRSVSSEDLRHAFPL